MTSVVKNGIQITCAVFLAGIYLPLCSTSYIQPDEIGVRKAVFGGIDDEDFAQGRHRDLPLLHSFYRLPRTVQYLDLRQFPVRNNQNNQFYVDATIIYEIVDGQAHMIGHEGLINTWRTKVKSVCEGFLRVHLAQLSNEDVLDADKRIEISLSAVKPLDVQLKQYHVRINGEGVVLRALRFESSFEGRLQAQQMLAVQARLDTAKEKESLARMETDTVKKGIDKDEAVEEQEWNKKIADLRRGWEIKIAEINAEAKRYNRGVKAAANAHYAESVALGDRAIAEAEALGEKLNAEALNTRAGRTYNAILAARNFQIGAIQLDSSDPQFLYRFASMGAWRRFFLPGSKP
jgi:hypothetical protein